MSDPVKIGLTAGLVIFALDFATDFIYAFFGKRRNRR
jgi:hypothetical protein